MRDIRVRWALEEAGVQYYVWLVALPFRIVGVVFSALLALLRALLFLPARVLGHRG